MSVGSNRSLTVPNSYNGPIYINGGNVDLQGAFTCGACTIVLTNKDTSNTATIGTFSSNAQATNNITAPTSGTYRRYRRLPGPPRHREHRQDQRRHEQCGQRGRLFSE